MAAVGCDINRFVLFPERKIEARPEQAGVRYETIEATNAFGRRLGGWLILPAGPPRAVVLISHGNAGNVGTFLPWAQMLADAGYAAALYDYQGYGESEGDASVDSLAGDGAAVIGWLRDRHWIGEPSSRQRELPGVSREDDAPPPQAKPLVLLGLSLGTLVSVRLAGETPEAAAAVLEGSLIPGEELKKKFGVLGAPVAWALCRQIPDELHTDRQIGRVRVPLLFVHSTEDEVTSLEGARDLFALANEPKRFVEAPGSTHLSPLFDWPAYRATVIGFLDEQFAGGADGKRP